MPDAACVRLSVGFLVWAQTPFPFLPIRHHTGPKNKSWERVPAGRHDTL